MRKRALLEIATGKQLVRRTRSSFREFAEQVIFADWCDLALAPRNILYSATMTGINLPPRVAAMAKRKGVRRGQPDFFIYHRVGEHTLLALEFKDPAGSGRRSVDQERWARELVAQGARVETPLTFLEAREITCQYLKIRA